MPDPRRFWDKELEGGLPDSRLAFNRHRSIIQVGRMEMEKVYCANCGCSGGAVTAEWAAHIFFICDDCKMKHGAPSGCVEADEATVRGAGEPLRA